MPYSLAPCFSRDVSQWGKPCFSNTKADHHDFMKGVDVNREDKLSNHFNSSMDVYNQYVRQYLALKQLGGFKNVLVTPYEDMVLTPELVLERFAKVAGWPIPQNGFQVLGDSSKEEEAGHGRDLALQKLRARPWLQEYKYALPMLCNGLDKEQIRQFKEGSYTSSPRPYAQDCK